MVKNIISKEGGSAFYRGFTSAMLKLVPAQGISFACYEVLKKYMNIK
jgi:hypothetical protein